MEEIRSVTKHIPPNSLFDVQVKRVHDYKRQLLNILYVITRHNDLVENIDHITSLVHLPRVVFFVRKADSGYDMVKLIIKLLIMVGNKINHEKRIDHKLKVLYLSNYHVPLAEKIVPATDLSEHISLAGLEAIGTGNMKFMCNSALTIGTMDGEEKMFIFGMRVNDVQKERLKYNPNYYYETNAKLQLALDEIRYGYFSSDNADVFEPIVESLLVHGDHYMLSKDFGVFA